MLFKPDQVRNLPGILPKTAGSISEGQTDYASFSSTCLNTVLCISVLVLKRTDELQLQFSLQGVTFDFAVSVVSRSHS